MDKHLTIPHPVLNNLLIFMLKPVSVAIEKTLRKKILIFSYKTRKKFHFFLE